MDALEPVSLERAENNIIAFIHDDFNNEVLMEIVPMDVQEASFISFYQFILNFYLTKH